MGDANVIDPKNEDGILAALQAMTLVVIGGNGINRNVANGLMHGVPVFSGGREALEDHRFAFSHVNIVVCSMLMASGDNMLFEGWPA